MDLSIKFGDLSREYTEIGSNIDAVISQVLTRGWYILGPEVSSFEENFAEYLRSRHCITCASGTEAISLALMAIDVKSGDEVITVSHTAVPTISAISMIGARPVFVDIDPNTCLMDVTQVEAAITPQTRAIIPVHLYGQCVDMDPLLVIANEHNIPVIEDCAQAHGATYKGQKAGTMGLLGAFSFYPSKNLGCYGDGGAVVTTDAALGDKIEMLRNYGQTQRYHHEIKGINSRLDELQAAILNIKLKYLDRYNSRRREIANQYTAGLQELPLQMPVEMPYNQHVYHLYVIQTSQRDTLQAYLSENGVQTLIHYPIPAHLQKAYAELGYESGSFPNTEHIAKSILSLPMYPQLQDEEIANINAAIRRFFS